MTTLRDADPPASDAAFEALWARVVEAWDDEKPHAAALDYALRNERLPDLAGRYRALKDDPEKAARAQKRLDAIVLAATQMLLATKTERRPADEGKPPRTLTLAVAVICIVVLLWLAHRILGR